MSKKMGDTWRIQSSFISSIISTTLVLYTLGILLLVLVNAQRLTEYVRENFVFSLILKENIRDMDARFLCKELALNPFVKQVEYIRKEQAAEEFTEYLGEDFLSLLGCNPFQPSLELHLRANWANNDSMQRIAEECMAIPNVIRVEYEKDKVENVNHNLQRLGLVLLSFSVIMAFIALVLINNTIRITVYSRRFIIKTMQLVGATANFARRPFLLRALRHGIYAAIFALLLLLGTVRFLQKQSYEFINLQQFDILVGIGIFLLFTGVLITLVTTYFSVNKYLHASYAKLFI